MPVIHQRGAGREIPKKMLVVTLLIPQAHGQVQQFTRPFATRTAELAA